LKRDRGGIYCAMQRVDGFVSMNASNTRGTLTTRRSSQSNRLGLNITPQQRQCEGGTSPDRWNPLPGFHHRRCEIISADELDYEVAGKAARTSAPLPETIRVQLDMRNAKTLRDAIQRRSKVMSEIRPYLKHETNSVHQYPRSLLPSPSPRLAPT